MKKPIKLGNFYLKSKYFAKQGVTKYLMCGGRSQITRSPEWARSFATFEDASNMAQKIGGFTVVELSEEYPGEISRV